MKTKVKHKIKMVKMKLRDWLDVSAKYRECMAANKALNKQIERAAAHIKKIKEMR